MFNLSSLFRPSHKTAVVAGLAVGLAAVFATTSLQAAPLAPSQIKTETPLTVVELYTSQGCSSCPPADTLLGELANQPNILALSFHVDYWDYIGWKDPYALKSGTERQRTYAEQLALRYVYTPQIIVGGSLEVVGSNRKEVRNCLKAINTKVDQPEQVQVKKLNGTTVELPQMGLENPLDIWYVHYTPYTQTKVLRGENRGKNLMHRNSVRALEKVGVWRGNATTLKLSDKKYEAAAILLQEQKSGPIRAALVLD